MARVEAIEQTCRSSLFSLSFFFLFSVRKRSIHGQTLVTRSGCRAGRTRRGRLRTTDSFLFRFFLSLSLSLVTRNRSRLIVKKKEKKESLVSVDTRLLLRSSSVRVRLSVKNKATTATPGLMMIFLSPLVPSYALLSLKSMDARCSWRLVEWFFFLLFFFSTIPGERKRI